MRGASYRPQRPGVRDGEREAFARASRLGLDGAVELRDVAIGTSATPVAHGLGRAPARWMLVDLDANARVWRAADSDERFLTLQASAACSVNLWVW